MYKVFLNERKIILTTPGKITLNKPIKTISNLTSKKDVENWFLEFVSSRVKEVALMNSAPDIFFKTMFQPVFNVIQAAGGIVKRNDKLLFIFRSNMWDLPKGKIDKEETTEAAAIREVEEECGISGHKIVKKMPSTFHIYKSSFAEAKGQWVLKETFWFEMEYSGVENGSPQLEENITEVKWLGKNELDDIFANTYENLKQIISLYRD